MLCIFKYDIFLLLAMGFFFHLDTTDNVTIGNSNGKIFPIANRFFFAIADLFAISTFARVNKYHYGKGQG